LAHRAEKLAFNNDTIVLALCDMVDCAVVPAHEVRPNISLVQEPVEAVRPEGFPNKGLEISAVVSLPMNAVVNARHTLPSNKADRSLPSETHLTSRSVLLLSYVNQPDLRFPAAKAKLGLSNERFRHPDVLCRLYLWGTHYT
jgi:hypothetical protein